MLLLHVCSLVGWCYCHGSWCCATSIYSVLADVIAMVVNVIITQGVYIVWQMLRPYVCLMELPQVSIYFKFSSEMLSRTSSHMCGRWYLPMFLLRDGLFALMYRASFMVLKRFWSSLPSMVKLSMVTSWPKILRWSYIGDGALRCSLYLSSKFLADSPIYSSSQSTLSHISIYDPTFLRIGSLSFGAMRRSLMVWPSLRNVCLPKYIEWIPCPIEQLHICCPWWLPGWFLLEHIVGICQCYDCI